MIFLLARKVHHSIFDSRLLETICMYRSRTISDMISTGKYPGGMNILFVTLQWYRFLFFALLWADFFPSFRWGGELILFLLLQPSEGHTECGLRRTASARWLTRLRSEPPPLLWNQLCQRSSGHQGIC